MTTRSMFERVPLGQNYFFSKSKPMPGGQYLTKVPDRLGDRPAGDLRPRLCWVRPALPELRAQEVQPRRRDMSHRESDRTATLSRQNQPMVASDVCQEWTCVGSFSPREQRKDRSQASWVSWGHRGPFDTLLDGALFPELIKENQTAPASCRSLCCWSGTCSKFGAGAIFSLRADTKERFGVSF